MEKRPIRNKAQREADKKAALEEAIKIHRPFWSRDRFLERFRGKPAEWMEFRRKAHVIEQALKNGTIDADKLLNEFDLVKYL